jgi:hypothetical protein
MSKNEAFRNELMNTFQLVINDKIIFDQAIKKVHDLNEANLQLENEVILFKSKYKFHVLSSFFSY